MSSSSAPLQNGPYTDKHKEEHKNTYNTKTQQTFLFHQFNSRRAFIIQQNTNSHATLEKKTKYKE